MECKIEIRADLHKNLSALTDAQLGAVLRLVCGRSIMEGKEVDEAEFFSHEHGIIALIAQLLWLDAKSLRLDPFPERVPDVRSLDEA